MQKISKIINVPKIINAKKVVNNINNSKDCQDNNKGRVGKTELNWDNKIQMKFINGKKLSEHLDNFSLTKQKQIMKLIAKAIAKLHQIHIIHGDLTTSNMIYVPNKKGDDKKNGKVYFIDFGLAFQNAKYEDKGVDIHLFKQALEAKHFKNYKILFQEFEKQYKKLEPKEAKRIFERLNSIEKRGRYRH